MQRMRRRVAAEVGRLLRVLLLRVGALPTDADRRVLFICFAAIGRRGNVGVKRAATRTGAAESTGPGVVPSGIPGRLAPIAVGRYIQREKTAGFWRLSFREPAAKAAPR